MTDEMIISNSAVKTNGTSYTTTASSYRVLLCDDHPVIREAVAGILESSDAMEVVAATSSFDEAVALIEDSDFDIAVLDVHLNGRSGLELAEQIRSTRPEVKVVLLTAFVSDELVLESKKVGVSEILDKNSDTDDIADRVLSVALGRSYLNQSRVAEVTERLKNDGIIDLLALNKTDRQILSLVAMGLSDKEIGARVYLSSQTVRNRISRLLSVLGRKNRTQMALMLNNLDEPIKARFMRDI